MSGKAFALTVAFVLIILGSYLFPDIVTLVNSTDTTGFGNILNAEHSLIPYVVLGAIGLGVYGLFQLVRRR